MDPTFFNHVLCFLNINFMFHIAFCLSFVPCFCLHVHVCHAQVGLLDMNFGGSGNQTMNVESKHNSFTLPRSSLFPRPFYVSACA